MSFNILYVEDALKDWESLEKAIREHNEKSSESPDKIDLTWARYPKELKEKLNHRVDIILADMSFYNPESEEYDNCLIEIINIVKKWEDENDTSRPLPIIAYTINGQKALQSSLKEKKDLFDIWDKSTASPEYVTWRLSKLSIELSRIRPDALMQTLIQTDIDENKRVRWHSHVLDMVKRYDEGWTEREQIEKAGKAIQNIAEELNVWDAVEPLWAVVTKWEFLGRAVSRRARGHARHAINVFWLGYYLIHNRQLRDFFIDRWEELKHDRSSMGPVKDDGSFEAINNVWFYIGLFHDMAGCLEKYSEISSFQKEIYSTFKNLGLKVPDTPNFKIDKVNKQANTLLNEFDGPLKIHLTEAWKESIKKEKADHGMLAALTLRQEISYKNQACYSREAARAISIHNLIGRVDKKKIDNLTWKKEPFACLLLLCDQIQTWDREREERQLSDIDEPERAELLGLSVVDSMQEEKPHITISIDYIAPPHLKHVPEIYNRVKDDLDFILRDKPKRAIKKIAGSWPFSLHVRFYINKEKLNARIKIPELEERQ